MEGTRLRRWVVTRACLAGEGQHCACCLVARLPSGMGVRWRGDEEDVASDCRRCILAQASRPARSWTDPRKAGTPLLCGVLLCLLLTHGVAMQ